MIVAAGPVEAQRRVLQWVEARRARRPEELWPVVRIVVPSRSLVRHLSAVLVRELRGMAGVLVQTHRALAREVLERAGEEPPPGASLVQELLVRRFAAAEPALASALDDVEDGYAPVAASVRDLVDAGMDAGATDTLKRAVRDSGLTGDRLARALAVVRVAGKVVEESEGRALPLGPTLLQRALVHVERDPAVLPARAVLIHGYADVTGRVGRFLAALAALGAEQILDHPPDPAAPHRPDSGRRFTERLVGLVGPGDLESWEAPESPAQLTFFRAPGPEAEVREIARRVVEFLEQGTTPESIAVVARRLDPSFLAVVRRQFSRLGIPFSAGNATVAGGAAHRRAAALAQLLTRGSLAPAASWLRLIREGSLPLSVETAELALRTAGAVTVADAGGLDPQRIGGDAGRIPLPVTEGIELRDGREIRRHRSIPMEHLEAVTRAAKELIALLEHRPDPGGRTELEDWVRKLLETLGWLNPADLDTGRALLGMVQGLPPGLEAPWSALAPVLAGRLPDTTRLAAGGASGGVQLLSVAEARARTFEHLFLAQLNRGVFPFRKPEDPVLPEAARRAMAPLLPAVPLARRSPQEERYLFAQLLASSRCVTLSCSIVDREGRERNPSAFLERLVLEGRLKADLHDLARDPLPVPDVFDRERDTELRPEVEHLCVAGLSGRRTEVVSLLQALRGEMGGHLGGLLEVLDPARPSQELGPLDGLTGLPVPEEIWVTRLEELSRCPFRYLAERELGIEDPPEARFADETVGGRLLGILVHAVLEEIAARAGAASRTILTQALAGRAIPVPWPENSELEQLVQRAARRLAVEEGRPALAPALAARARPFLEEARRLDWVKDLPHVAGVEVSGTHELAAKGQILVVHFRADRVDVSTEGKPRLTDYKTGKVTTAVRTKKRVQYVRQGKLLQGGAYALSAPGAVGRYLSLAERLADKDRTAELNGDEDAAEISLAVETAVGEILACWAAGVHIPRVDDENEAQCAYCAARLACHRDDTTYRRRVTEAVAALDEDHPVRRLWRQRKAEMPEDSR